MPLLTESSVAFMDCLVGSESHEVVHFIFVSLVKFSDEFQLGFNASIEHEATMAYNLFALGTARPVSNRELHDKFMLNLVHEVVMHVSVKCRNVVCASVSD